MSALHGKDILNQKIKQIEIKRAKQGKAPITARYRANLNKYILLNGSNYLSYLETSSIDFFQITVNDSKGVSIEDIRVFQEKRDISVNVYFNKGSYLKRILGTDSVKKHHVNLLLLKREANQNHYVLINDIASFRGKTHGQRHEFCPTCEKPFRQKYVLEQHTCGADAVQIISSPLDKVYKFSKLSLTL